MAVSKTTDRREGRPGQGSDHMSAQAELHCLCLPPHILLLQPPPRRKDNQINSSNVFSGNHRFPITDFLVIAQDEFSRKFSGNHVTNISGNPCSSPIHIASRCAATRPNFPVIPWRLIPQKLFLVHVTDFCR